MKTQNVQLANNAKRDLVNQLLTAANMLAQIQGTPGHKCNNCFE